MSVSSGLVYRTNHEGLPVASPQHLPKPSRVSWYPLADLIDNEINIERSQLHSGRPALEQIPLLPVYSLKKLGAGHPEGLMLDLQAEDGPLSVVVFVRADFREDGGSLHVRWQHTPALGNPTMKRKTISLSAEPRKVGRCYAAECPTCGKRSRRLCWAVHTFACHECLAVKSASRRLGHKYVVEKQVRRLREALGQEPGLLKPIFVKNPTPAKRRMAEALWEAEFELLRQQLGA
ncbi:MAG: hypothetical protein AAFV45_15335 [Pseudomonadota bacterium]